MSFLQKLCCIHQNQSILCHKHIFRMYPWSGWFITHSWSYDLNVRWFVCKVKYIANWPTIHAKFNMYRKSVPHPPVLLCKRFHRLSIMSIHFNVSVARSRHRARWALPRHIKQPDIRYHIAPRLRYPVPHWLHCWFLCLSHVVCAFAV